MLSTLLLAGIFISVSTPAPSPTLANIALGDSLSAVLATHPNTKTSTGGSTSIATWDRPTGGTVTVFANAQGSIVRIEFDAKLGQRGLIDLPCAREFDIEGSHVNLGFAAESSGICMGDLSALARYTLTDGSIFEATFYGPADGPLKEAIWYSP